MPAFASDLPPYPVSPLEHPCPVCKAEVGQWCFRRDGAKFHRRRSLRHAARTRQASFRRTGARWRREDIAFLAGGGAGEWREKRQIEKECRQLRHEADQALARMERQADARAVREGQPTRIPPRPQGAAGDPEEA